jgi:hypothetical protein
MSITNELREWAHGFNGPWKAHEQTINAIADRIDERVKNIRFNEHHKGYQDGIMDGCSHYDPERTECMVSEEHAYIKLPVDADGEPIHIGDVMEWPTTGETFEVVGIGDGTLFYIEDGNELADWTGASTKRHYHKPTVEDVLFESLKHFGAVEERTPEVDKWLCEQAQRLRLREDV